MQVKAHLRHLRISPKKVRLVADLVRGLPTTQAVKQLQFLNKKSARPIRKLIESAVANATHNFKLSADNLKLETIYVNEGRTLKRWLPRAFGRATPLRKRSSHVSIGLAEIIKTSAPVATSKTSETKAKSVDKVEVVSDLKKVSADGNKDKSGQGNSKKNIQSGHTRRVFNRKAG